MIIMLKYKFDVLMRLRHIGWYPDRLSREKILTGHTLTSLRHNRPISWSSLSKICDLLNCQPGDIIERTVT